jgi:two-component system sensor histidine kinase KdpD
MSLSSDTDAARRPADVPAAARYLLALVLVFAAILGAVVVEHLVGASDLSLIFVLPVVIAAASFGWGPALLAALGGVAAFNFFFLEPRYSLQVEDAANVWALGLLMAVAAIVSAVAAQARARAREAWRHADQALALQALARTLMGAVDRTGAAVASAEALARLFQTSAVVLLETDEALALTAAAGGATLSPADEEAARWALASRLPTRAGAYPVEEAGFDFWPVKGASRRRAVVGVRLSDPDAGRPADPERLVEIVGGYLSVALGREEFADQVLESRLAMASQKLKADLLAAVSHDLKTPLSTILFTLQSLQRFAKDHDAKARAELLALAEAETARLSGLVSNLLDMSRLDADAVVVRKTVIAPAELAVRASERAAAAMAGRTLVDEVDPAAPDLFADVALTETALANVLENAGKYTAAGSVIRLRFAAEDGFGVLEVADEGPGFPGAVEPLFERFTRGVQGDGRPPGTGLGLAIARGFVEAQGGRVEASNRPDGPGARVRLVLPLAAADMAPA